MEQIEGFMVFWVQCNPYIASDRPMKPQARHFEMNEMSAALKYMDALRNEGDAQFVTMVSQNSNSVGKVGVDSVVDGKTPDGEVYDWNKSSRIGATKRSERNSVIVKTE